MLRFAVSIAFLILIDLYFYQAVRQFLAPLDPRWRIGLSIIYWSGTAVAVAALVLGATMEHWPPYARFYLMSVMMVLIAPKLLGLVVLLGEDVVRVVVGSFGKLTSSGEPFLADRRRFVASAAMVAAAVPFASMLYGMARTAFNFTVRKRTLHFANLPEAFDGLRLLQISDMHLGSFASTESIRRAFDLIMQQKADIIVFTGDMVNNKAEEAEPFRELLATLKAPLGVFSVLGNHDYGDYVPWESATAKRANLDRLKELQRGAGWDLLINEHRIIERNGQQIALLGVENWGAAMRFPKYGNLNRAADGTAQVPFKVLLSHDPSHWEAEVIPAFPHIDLTLSGHTHGFQFGIEIPGLKWSPVQYVYGQWAGLYRKGTQYIYVNRGLGFLGFMGRIGIAPEITVLEFRRGEKA